MIRVGKDRRRGELGCAHLFYSDWVVRNFLGRVVLCATFLDGLCCAQLLRAGCVVRKVVLCASLGNRYLGWVVR